MGDTASYDSRETARGVLERYRVIAVVGLSPDERRPSHGVASYLARQGYTIVPVYPGVEEVLGEKAYASLLEIPPSLGVEVVDVFRQSQHALAHAREAVTIGARAFWMQDGVINEEAARVATEAGLTVVMNRCMARDHAAMFS